MLNRSLKGLLNSLCDYSLLDEEDYYRIINHFRNLDASFEEKKLLAKKLVLGMGYAEKRSEANFFIANNNSFMEEEDDEFYNDDDEYTIDLKMVYDYADQVAILLRDAVIEKLNIESDDDVEDIEEELEDYIDSLDEFDNEEDVLFDKLYSIYNKDEEYKFEQAWNKFSEIDDEDERIKKIKSFYEYASEANQKLISDLNIRKSEFNKSLENELKKF